MHGQAAIAASPLAGLRLVEFSSIGPAPFAVMLLSDLGVEVLRIERPDEEWPDIPIISRGRATMTLDLKSEVDRNRAAAIAGAADILVEGYRPGAMERLGLGPEELCKRNERLVYGRMTGWGQSGPLARCAGHDINYIALAGALDALMKGHGEAPAPPLNLLGDYAGGSLYLVIGILAALAERERSGRGQIVDAAIVDGTASILAPILGMIAAGLLPPKPSEGMLGGSAPFYRTYICADGRHIAVGPLEPRFRRRLSELLGIDPSSFDEGNEVDIIESLFASRSRDEWKFLFDDPDCCVTPVAGLTEAPAHPHLAARETFTIADGLAQPSPAPRFSRTPGAIQATTDATERLRAWGLEERETA